MGEIWGQVIFGLVNLEFAIGADSGIAILVILNGLRLIRFKLPFYAAY
jgi:cation transport ATPase